jgi:hypothetical protein
MKWLRKFIGPKPHDDTWREDFRSYCTQWGYSPRSGAGKLIDFLRDEHRIKYGCEYRLRRIARKHWQVVSGSRSAFGIEYVRIYSRSR